ncbi:MAG TPA: protein-glutamate O-methyltransferase CheR [Bacteroidota bacterium]|nr:protein-glutamate O-methyltransferase CheR [Candidatus Kapabacteria bacterium]HRS01717.1 protein-glutamate O-methyltransferase CheR [Bacteroidota bacterium]
MENINSTNPTNQFEIISISDEEFNLLRELIYSSSGISLADQKKALVVGRLQKVLKKHSLKNFKDYYNELLNDRSGALLTELIDHISTNHTFFGRENDHFEYFQNFVLPEIVSRKIESHDFDLRVWSAGCSTGEEPYTLVILMKEFFKNDYNKWKAGVLATDISTTVLSNAIQGIYDVAKFKGFNTEWLRKYFKQIDENKLEINSDIKSEVVFRRFNLISSNYGFKKSFDVIFCRNVMIYFDKKTRLKVVQNLYDCLAQDGYLFIGHAETIDRTQSKFQYIAPSVYKK